jgi:hypothetical protein
MTPRSTLIFHGGFDSIVEELYFRAWARATPDGTSCVRARVSGVADGLGQSLELTRDPVRSSPE